MKLTHADFPVGPIAAAKAARFANRLLGEAIPDADVRGCEGVLLSPNVALVCTEPDEPFTVLVLLGEQWRVGIEAVARHEPSIIEHRGQFVRIPDPERDALAERRRLRKEQQERERAEREAEDARYLEERRREWAKQARAESEAHYRQYGGLLGSTH